MAINPNRLGRGLGTDILFLSKEKKLNADSPAQLVPLAELRPNPNQPRREFDPSTLEELAESIRSQGILQPILVRTDKNSSAQGYEIVAGERRWRAAGMAGLKDAPVIIREFTDQETLIAALAENLQREDLNPLEEAQGLVRLKEEFNISQDEIAKFLGKKRSTIANSLRLLHLGDAAKKALQESKISAGHARALLSLPSLEEQEALLQRIILEQLNVRDTEGLASLQKNSPSHAQEGIEQSITRSSVPLSPETSNGKTSGQSAKAPQSALMLTLQNKISEHINLPVKINGGENQGKVSISYSSKNQLAELLAKIGLLMEN
ncbi:MAG: ParB/RepB/Spo0J family partition protein [Deltaproteobacteria bacterium]|jgi:ParB family chromosome partitioning protein|nr:ParB/RepB/Spo0J family partition protein [Deltaproteobacteria bacterium]